MKKLDLSNIDFKDKNISNIDFSFNPEININVDEVIKNFTNTSFKGINLNKQVFRNAKIINADLRETGATIDIGTCSFNMESKMNKGTLFDENNKFVLGDKKLKLEDVKNIGVKVYRKEK